MSPSMIARTVFTIASGVLMFSVLSPISRAAEVDPSGYLSRLMGNRISITGQCTVTVKPDVASITVGLDGEGDTPDEARRAMDDLRGKIRALVSGHRGQVKEQEMIRMMRSGDPLPVSVVPPGMPVMPSAPATEKPLSSASAWTWNFRCPRTSTPSCSDSTRPASSASVASP